MDGGTDQQSLFPKTVQYGAQQSCARRLYNLRKPPRELPPIPLASEYRPCATSRITHHEAGPTDEDQTVGGYKYQILDLWLRA